MPLSCCNMEGVHIRLGPYLDDFQVAKFKQVDEGVEEIILCGYVEGSFLLVVLKRHQRRWIGPFILDEAPRSFEIVGSSRGEEFKKKRQRKKEEDTSITLVASISFALKYYIMRFYFARWDVYRRVVFATLPLLLL